MFLDLSPFVALIDISSHRTKINMDSAVKKPSGDKRMPADNQQAATKMPAIEEGPANVPYDAMLPKVTDKARLFQLPADAYNLDHKVCFILCALLLPVFRLKLPASQMRFDSPLCLFFVKPSPSGLVNLDRVLVGQCGTCERDPFVICIPGP